jgi:hypothetical protein
MENYAYEHHDELSESNYVCTASPNTDYWVDFHFPKLNAYKEKFGDNELRIDAAEGNKANARLLGAAASIRVGLSRTTKGTCLRFGN